MKDNCQRKMAKIQTIFVELLEMNWKRLYTRLKSFFNQYQASSALFFQYNEQLGPPYHVIVDTNFINFTLKNRLDLNEGMKDCLMAKVTVHVTDCVVAELEKLGPKYRVALRIAQQLGKYFYWRTNFQFRFCFVTRFQNYLSDRLPCQHKGTYADDCLVNRVTQHKVKTFIVYTPDFTSFF